MSGAARASLIVGVGVLAVRALALNHALIGVVYDDGLYAGIAIALSHGLGYVHPHLPGTPAVVHYPPLYPLLLAPFFGTMSVAAAGFTAKVVNLIIAALGAGLIAWHAARTRILGDDAPAWLAPTVVATAALAIPCLTLQAALFAEPLFVLLLAVAVNLTDTPPANWPPGRSAAMAGVAAAAALLTRSIGVAGGAGIVVFLLVGRRVPPRRALVALMPVAIAALGWGWWTAVHAAGIDAGMAMNYGSYAEVVKQSGLATYARSVPDLVRPLGTITLAWIGSRPLYYLFGIPAMAVGLYGLWLVSRRSAVGFTLLGYLGILALWPYDPDRFEWALLPWIALVWTAGAVGLSARAPQLRFPIGLLASAMVMGYGLQEVTGLAHRGWRMEYVPATAAFSEMLPAVSNLPANSVLASDGEALLWLYTRRTTVPFYVYGFHGDQWTRPTAAAHRAYLERQGVTHILVTGLGGGSAEELDALLGTYPQWLTVVHVWPGGKALFRVNR